MAEYIVKEQALEAILSAIDLTGEQWAQVWNKIKQTPAADVAPVVHAEWIGTWGDGYADGPDGEPVIVYEEFECSRCGCVHHADGEPTWDYCPECGARMDGGADQ